VITAGETEVLAFTLVMLPYQASQNSFFIDVEQVSGLSVVCHYLLPVHRVHRVLEKSLNFVLSVCHEP